ncbi:MAG: fluoride efflux transporter CrcB [Cellvibrionaceae bacterium]
MNFIAVALGGALGALSRYCIIAYVFPVQANRFPTGTLVANVVGCILIGIFYVVIVQKNLLGPQWRLFIITGLLGALTTFSTFSIEAVQLWEYGHSGMALVYITSSLVACLMGTTLAMYFTARVINY